MADKKFGQKRVCPHCEKKFYDLNKKSPFKCPCGEKEITVEEEILNFNSSQLNQQEKKTEIKDEFTDIENTDDQSDEEDVISLDDAAIEEEDDSSKN